MVTLVRMASSETPGGQNNVLPVPEGDFANRLSTDGDGWADEVSTVQGGGTGPHSLGSTMAEGPVANTAKRFHAAFVRESLAAGGPDKYLQKKYDTPEKKLEFAGKLVKLLPLSFQHEYSLKKMLPTVAEGELSEQNAMFIHPAALAFSADATSHDFVDHAKVAKLAAEMCSDGCVTQGDELLCFQSLELADEKLKMPSEFTGALQDEATSYFSFGYIKGFARATTLLMLLDLYMVDCPDDDIKVILPQFANANVIAIKVPPPPPLSPPPPPSPPPPSSSSSSSSSSSPPNLLALVFLCPPRPPLARGPVGRACQRRLAASAPGRASRPWMAWHSHTLTPSSSPLVSPLPPPIIARSWRRGTESTLR